MAEKTIPSITMPEAALAFRKNVVRREEKLLGRYNTRSRWAGMRDVRRYIGI